VPGPETWTLLLNTSTAPTPLEMFNALVEVGRGELRAERLEAPVQTLTIRGNGGGSEGAFIIEWERVRIRIPLRIRQ